MSSPRSPRRGLVGRVPALALALTLALTLAPTLTSTVLATDRRAAVIPALTKAPALDGRTITGATWRLRDQAGHWTVVAFQAKWCVPCRTEVKELLALRKAVPGVRVVTVGFASSKDETSALVRDLGITWPAIADPEGRIGERWAVAGLPATVVVDPDGAIAKRFLGGVSAAKVQQIIQRKAAQ